MKFAKVVFMIAGVFGVLFVGPMYFLEGYVSSQGLPVNHPETFYGFIGVTLSWQIGFLIIATDPMRFRPLMYAACLEKISFGVAIPILYAMGRVQLPVLIASICDLILLVLFVMALVTTAREASKQSAVTDA